MPVTYNTANATLSRVFTASSGGTVFSADLKGNAVFDYFTDTAVVNDALYIGVIASGLWGTNNQHFSDVAFNIGTPIAGTGITIAWEYWNGSAWTAVVSYQDDTVGFTASGAKSFKWGMQPTQTQATVNGILASWLRARMSALTTITEGGANQTSVITVKDGKVNIDSYTDGSPCTLAAIKTVLDSYPWLHATKTLHHYDLSAVSLMVNSRLKVSNESFEIGVGGASPGYSYLNYLTMGDKVSAYYGRNGGTLWIKSNTNSYPFAFSTNTKLYGSNLIGIGGAGYPIINGEFIDCNIDSINASMSVSGNFSNCRFVDPGIWLINTFPTTFDSNSVLMTGSSLGYFYRGNVTIPNLSWAATGNINLFYFNQTQNDVQIILTNPSPALPAIASASHVVARRTGTPNLQHTKVFFYDTSAATYTDYTTAFNDATADDAPIHGDVGDYYLFGYTGYIQCLHWLVSTSLASNDYVYAFEYLRSGVWYAISPINDRTNNFTVNSENIYGGLDGQTNLPAQTSTAINGTTAYWVRLRIVTKGSGTPTISRILHYGDAETGCASWNVYEKYTLDISVKDKSNTAITTANVRIDLDGVNVYSGVTDSGGVMTQQTLTARRWYFDPINAWTNWHQIAEEVKSAYDVVISKDGYETCKFKILMEKKETLTLTLNRSITKGREQMGSEW